MSFLRNYVDSVKKSARKFVQHFFKMFAVLHKKFLNQGRKFSIIYAYPFAMYLSKGAGGDF